MDRRDEVTSRPETVVDIIYGNGSIEEMRGLRLGNVHSGNCEKSFSEYNGHAVQIGFEVILLLRSSPCSTRHLHGGKCLIDLDHLLCTYHAQQDSFMQYNTAAR